MKCINKQREDESFLKSIRIGKLLNDLLSWYLVKSLSVIFADNYLFREFRQRERFFYFAFLKNINWDIRVKVRKQYNREVVSEGIRENEHDWIDQKE